MIFAVSHITSYKYSEPAMEAYLEVRLSPPQRATQEILSHRIEFTPPTASASDYDDYFGNRATVYSMPLRHQHMKVASHLTVRTASSPRPAAALALTVAEARQVLRSARSAMFDYIQPTPNVPLGGLSIPWAKSLVREGDHLGDCLERLNGKIQQEFTYRSGSTDNETPLEAVWKTREGVCQDFAHIMLGVLRTAGLPCRYVCGYIDSEPLCNGDLGSNRLVGSLSTHAWIEVLVPGMKWVALDPTNNQWCGEQHIAVSTGRDYLDAAPVRGTFKGSASQIMKAHVTMRRIPEKP
jgi:transglutaminase-like putative cysteine protease